ncbi:MAG: cellulose binding domain-containing protein [Carbonactinosporaceae bacterium]
MRRHAQAVLDDPVRRLVITGGVVVTLPLVLVLGAAALIHDEPNTVVAEQPRSDRLCPEGMGECTAQSAVSSSELPGSATSAVRTRPSDLVGLPFGLVEDDALTGAPAAGTEQPLASAPVSGTSVAPSSPTPARHPAGRGDSTGGDRGPSLPVPVVEIRTVDVWQGGFSTKVTIVNVTDEPVRGWKLRFRLGNADVTTSWNADVSEDEGDVTADDVTANELIPPDGVVQFGFTADGRPTPPRSCAFNGGPCGSPD